MVIERVAHTIKRAYAMVVSSVEGGGPKTRVGTAARGHGELRAEIARFAQIAEIDGLTAQVPTPPGDHHHPCPKVRIPIVTGAPDVRGGPGRGRFRQGHRRAPAGSKVAAPGPPSVL